jgi:hypothetical protein
LPAISRVIDRHITAGITLKPVSSYFWGRNGDRASARASRPCNVRQIGR